MFLIKCCTCWAISTELELWTGSERNQTSTESTAHVVARRRSSPGFLFRHERLGQLVLLLPMAPRAFQARIQLPSNHATMGDLLDRRSVLSGSEWALSVASQSQFPSDFRTQHYGQSEKYYSRKSFRIHRNSQGLCHVFSVDQFFFSRQNNLKKKRVPFLPAHQRFGSIHRPGGNSG